MTKLICPNLSLNAYFALGFLFNSSCVFFLENRMYPKMSHVWGNEYYTKRIMMLKMKRKKNHSNNEAIVQNVFVYSICRLLFFGMWKSLCVCVCVRVWPQKKTKTWVIHTARTVHALIFFSSFFLCFFLVAYLFVRCTIHSLTHTHININIIFSSIFYYSVLVCACKKKYNVIEFKFWGKRSNDTSGSTAAATALEPIKTEKKYTHANKHIHTQTHFIVWCCVISTKPEWNVYNYALLFSLARFYRFFE